MFISCGEVSGDFHGANLVSELKKIKSDLEIFGIGQQKMERAGVKLLFNSSRWGVIGLTEIFRVIPQLLMAFRKLKKFFEEEKINLLLLIDYPGFNLRLGKLAKKMGITVIYYIPPILWGRKGQREVEVGKIADKILVTNPSDVKIYEKAKDDVVFVGNPLIDEVKIKFSKEKIYALLSLNKEDKVISLLPGSREQEIKTLLPVMLGVAKRIKEKYPQTQFFIPVASSSLKELIENITNGHHVNLIENMTYEIISISSLAIVCSGTATLETALLETPMIIVYKVSKITEFVARSFVLDKVIIGMPNIIEEKMIVPEVLQEDVNVEYLSKVTFELLKDEQKLNEMRYNLRNLRKKLGNEGATRKAAEEILGAIN